MTSCERLFKWDMRFLQLAREVSSWSKDPSTQCGAVIVRDGNKVVSMGYNGFPEDVEDRPEWLNNRAEKYPRMVHAEINAIRHAARYSGLSMVGATIYVYPFSPCADCAAEIVWEQLTRVVHPLGSDEAFSRWGPSWVKAAKRFMESGIQRDVYDVSF